MITQAQELIYRDEIKNAEISKHNYKTVDYDTPPNVHVLICQDCGHESVSWSWGSLEAQK